jgi:hypothetical protein
MGLSSGREYKFTVTAYNFNGAGANSNTYSFYSCVNPSQFLAPLRSTSTKTSITITWNEPIKNGGCPITGYIIYMDDGVTRNVYTEVNSVNDPAVRNIPGL